MLLVEIGHQQPLFVADESLEVAAAAAEHRRAQFAALEIVSICEFDQARLHWFVFDFEMQQPASIACLKCGIELVLVAVLAAGIELPVDNVVSFGTQLVGVGAHRGEKQHDFLLMVANVGTETHVLGQEYSGLGRWWQVLRREQLIAEDDEQRVSLAHDGLRRACSSPRAIASGEIGV